MSFEATIRTYLREYQNEYKAALRGGEHTPELSFRVPMHKMFESIAKDLNPTVNCDVILEPRNQGRMGRPDWRIQDSISLGVFGYIEAKGVTNETFDLTPYKDQIDRYLSLGHKLIITDGIEFVFCFNSKPIIISIIDKSKMDSSDWPCLFVDSHFRFYMEKFFSNPAPQYVDEEKLVELVAIRTRNLADEIEKYANLNIDEACSDDERQEIRLLEGLKEQIFNHNDPNFRTNRIFADYTAQVIMFCLLYAHRVICSIEDSPAEKIAKIRNFAFEDIVEGKELLPFRNLMVYLRDHANADAFISQWVEECLLFLSFVRMSEQQLTNPDFHHLFEVFLNKFDKQTRFDYGAFYTPKILAKFVVNFVNRIVKDCFDGATIYDDNNTIIDPCCGTGSFLEQLVANDNSDGSYNLCGFEILPAPYMLANYRMKLVENGYGKQNLKSNIILANTLSNCLLNEDADDRSIEGRELIRAKDLSSRPLKLIIGNPPSSDSKRNNESKEFSQIVKLMEDFRPPQANRHGRQNIQKQINNPFMQFLRWSCEKLFASNNHSVLAFVVPLSFLETESYKYARKFLVEHFSDIWTIAIDADARAGIRGDSLFMTMQGRAVILLTRKYSEEKNISAINYIDLSRTKRNEKERILSGRMDDVMNLFKSFPLNTATYSFIPFHPFNEDLYASFWPISTETNNPGIFIHQCSGAKMAPTALLTHVRASILKRRSREIANEGIRKAHEWLKGQDKNTADEKIIAFQQALNSFKNHQELDSILDQSIYACSFRPFVNSKALLLKKIFDFQKGVGGGGARIRPEIKAVYESPETIGFSLAHAPKDLNEELGRFTSFCWYFPDNDLSRRGNGHIYLNQYITNTSTGQPIENVHQALLNYFAEHTNLSIHECGKKMVYYAYAIFCSQVYLEEFYGALYVVNQTENRARIPIVRDIDLFLRLAEFGEQLANIEKNDVAIDNILLLDYDDLLKQIYPGFRLDHSRSGSKSPYDEENELLIIRDVNRLEKTIKIYCPVALQQFTIAGYNVIKDCWLKFHSYRYTHCDFSKKEFKELLDLLNKIAKQIQIVSNIDDVVHDIVNSNIPLLNYNDFQ